jgi:hypothetical protein
MFSETSGPLSVPGIESGAYAAYWPAGAENVPEEISLCGQLVQLILRDTKCLAELRDEKHQDLKGTPRLDKIKEIINNAYQSLAEADRLLEKYRGQRDDKTDQPNLRMAWLLTDTESLVLCSRNLETQHRSVLNEINWLKSYPTRGVIMPVAVNSPQRQFENVELLKSFLGSRKPSGQSTLRRRE